MPPKNSLPEILLAVRAFLAAEYPSSEPQRLTLAFRFRGADEVLRVPLAPVAQITPAEPAAELREEILRGLDEAGCALKGSALAKRIGRTYSGHFREVLAALLADGELGRGADGKFALPA